MLVASITVISVTIPAQLAWVPGVSTLVVEESVRSTSLAIGRTIAINLMVMLIILGFFSVLVILVGVHVVHFFITIHNRSSRMVFVSIGVIFVYRVR